MRPCVCFCHAHVLASDGWRFRSAQIKSWPCAPVSSSSSSRKNTQVIWFFCSSLPKAWTSPSCTPFTCTNRSPETTVCASSGFPTLRSCSWFHLSIGLPEDYRHNSFRPASHASQHSVPALQVGKSSHQFSYLLFPANTKRVHCRSQRRCPISPFSSRLAHMRVPISNCKRGKVSVL